MFHIHTGLLAVSFYLLFGATLSLTFKKVTLCNKICGKLTDQPGSVVVYKGCSEAEARGLMLGGYTHSFLFSLI